MNEKMECITERKNKQFIDQTILRLSHSLSFHSGSI